MSKRTQTRYAPGLPNFVVMLTAEEELYYIAELRKAYETCDQPRIREIETKLVTHYNPIIARLSRKYGADQTTQDDIVAAAQLGMTMAIQRFNPDLGYRLSTFIMNMARCAILDHITAVNNDMRTLKSGPMKSLFFRIRREPEIRDTFTPSQEAIQAVADRYQIDPREVESILQLKRGHASMQAPTRMGDGDDVGSYGDMFTSGGNAEDAIVHSDTEELQKELIQIALKKLPERDRDILVNRLLVDKEDEVTLQELADKYEISRERVRQLQVKALQSFTTSITRSMKEYRITPRDLFAPAPDNTPEFAL